MGYTQHRNVPWQEVFGADGEKIFAIGGSVQGVVSSTVHAAGIVHLTSAAVPAGTVWVITSAMVVDVSNVPTSESINITRSATIYQAVTGVQPNVNTGVAIVTQLILFPGDTLDVYFLGTLLNDACYFYFTGYSMTIP